MSFPKSLDECTETQLLDELIHRRNLRADGLCDYCGRPSSTDPCKFENRHYAEANPLFGREAEELRTGIEDIIKRNPSEDEWPELLQNLLDAVDAQDSFFFLVTKGGSQ